MDKFLIESVHPDSNPTVRLLLIRQGAKDILCINMNHTPADGSGLKEFTYILADIYNKLLLDFDYLPTPNIIGSLSEKQVLKKFNWRNKLRFFLNGIAIRRPHKAWNFIWENSSSQRERILLSLTLPTEIMVLIKAFCKKHDVTINDVFLAGYVRAIDKVIVSSQFVIKPVLVSVDLRKHIPSKRPEAICCLTSLMVCKLGWNLRASFSETVSIVHSQMKYNKAKQAELHMMIPFFMGVKYF